MTLMPFKKSVTLQMIENMKQYECAKEKKKNVNMFCKIMFIML